MFQKLKVMADTLVVILPKLLAYRFRGCWDFILKRILKVRFLPDGYDIIYTHKSSYDQKRVRLQTAELLLNFPNSIKENFKILLLVTKRVHYFESGKKNWKQNELRIEGL